jgi:hypothetical protein
MPNQDRSKRIQLPEITLESHRCFRDEATLRLRPLTLLYGRNQAGKSTLARLLPLLGDSLDSRSGPLDMTSPALRGATFKELGWLGPDYQATQRFRFHTQQDGGLKRSIRVDIVDESQGPIINRIVAIEGTDVLFDAALDSGLVAGQPRATYRGTSGGSAWQGDLDIYSLMPKSLPGVAQAVLVDVLASMEKLKRLQWLHAHRLASHRELSARPTRYCAPNGADLPSLLQRFPEAVRLASDWLSRADISLGELRLGRDGEGAPRLEIRTRPGWEFLPSALAGEGLRALLPVLLCACWSETYPDQAPALLVVEEPEGQLHPQLQVALARRLTDAVYRGLPVVAETHSVHVLRAMQLAVLDGVLQPDDVGLYWVEQSKEGASHLTPIEVQADASLHGWPPGVFEEEQMLAQEIFSKRWAREEVK